MHHYECVVLCKDISLQGGNFVLDLYSLIYPKIQQRQVIVAIKIILFFKIFTVFY